MDLQLANFDAFGRLRVSNPSTVLDVKQVNDNAPLVYVEDFVGAGSATWVKARAASELSPGSTTPGDKATRQTRRYLNYKPLKSQEVAITFTARNLVEGGEMRIGLFDDNNGIFVRITASAISFVIRNGGVDTEEKYQRDWNLDSLDGNWRGGFNLNPDAAQILMLDLAWLGVGTVRIGFKIAGEVIYAHAFHHANVVDAVYMQTPNLPVRWEVINTGTPASIPLLDQICCAIISEGGQNAVGIERGSMTGQGDEVNVSSDLRPIVSIRLKATHNRATVIPTVASLLSLSNGNIRWMLQFNPTVTGGVAGTWAAKTGSAVEANTTKGAATVAEDGIDVGLGLIANNVDQAVEKLSSVLTLASDYDGVPDELVLAASLATGGGSDNVMGALKWLELT